MHRIRVFVLALLCACLGLLAVAAVAEAHVTVTAPGATRGGGDQEITFRVPVEKDVATVGLSVALPTSTPIASVLVEPVQGWTHTQKTTKLAKPIVTDDGDITTAVTEVTWTAAKGHGLQPGEFGAFTIIAGQLPDASSLTFPAVQTYADGSVVRWNQVAAPGAKDEPDNPAPQLDLAAAASTGKAGSSSTSSSTTVPTVLAIIALVLAALALAAAVLLGMRARRREAT